MADNTETELTPEFVEQPLPQGKIGGGSFTTNFQRYLDRNCTVQTSFERYLARFD